MIEYEKENRIREKICFCACDISLDKWNLWGRMRQGGLVPHVQYLPYLGIVMSYPALCTPLCAIQCK